MSGPPNDVEPSELWRRLNESPRPSEVIDFPRKDANGKPLSRVRIQVLRMLEHDQARIRAHEWLKNKKIPAKEFEGITIREVYGDAVARELLAMACVSDEPIKGTEDSGAPKYARLFRSGEDMETLTADELVVLFTAYEMCQRKFGPYEGNIESEEELNQWVARLAEGGNRFPLAQLSWHQLVELTMLLSERAYCLSALLDYQSSSLEGISESLQKKWAIGTGFFGRLRASVIKHGLNLLSDGEDEVLEDSENIEQILRSEQADLDRHRAADAGPLDLPDPGISITTEEAARYAQLIHKHGKDE